MTFVSAPSTLAPSRLREPAKTLREKGADSFHAALAAVLAAGLEAALEAGDHPRAISFINRGFACSSLDRPSGSRHGLGHWDHDAERVPTRLAGRVGRVPI